MSDRPSSGRFSAILTTSPRSSRTIRQRLEWSTFARTWVVQGARASRGRETLGLDEEVAIAVLERLAEQGRGQAGLADAGGANEDDVLGAGHVAEGGELADDGLLDAGLLLEGEGPECPRGRNPGALDALGDAALLAKEILGADAVALAAPVSLVSVPKSMLTWERG
jgi:hypothetical protein